MRTLFVVLSFAIISVIACKKETSDKLSVPAISSVTDNFEEDTNFDADEYSDDEDSYQSEAATAMKVLYVTATDSLPYYSDIATLKRQKYGRRQVVSTTAKTRFTLRGYGFKARSDTSKVQCIIKKDTLGYAEIVSWADSNIVVNVPILVNAEAIAKQFSLKFKVFRSNDKLNKLPVSRVKSRASISSVQVAIVRAGTTGSGSGTGTGNGSSVVFMTAAASFDSIKAIRASFGFGGYPAGTWSVINSDYTPQKGDVLSAQNSDAIDSTAVILLQDATTETANGSSYLRANAFSGAAKANAARGYVTSPFGGLTSSLNFNFNDAGLASQIKFYYKR